jgi:hypothetical protein
MTSQELAIATIVFWIIMAAIVAITAAHRKRHRHN